jgi:hypothetical protein
VRQERNGRDGDLDLEAGLIFAWRAVAFVSRDPLTVLDYTNLRILPHRPFLIVLARNKQDKHRQDITVSRNASKCIELSIWLIKTISSICYAINDVLGAAIFQLHYHLWNATVSLLLYRAVQHKLSATTIDHLVVGEHVGLTIDFFSANAGSVQIARLAHEEITRVQQQLSNQRDQPIPDFDEDAHMDFDASSISWPLPGVVYTSMET